MSPPRKKPKIIEKVEDQLFTPEVGDLMVMSFTLAGSIKDGRTARELSLTVAPVIEVMTHGRDNKVFYDLDATKTFKISVGIDYFMKAEDVAEKLLNLSRLIKMGVK